MNRKFISIIALATCVSVGCNKLETSETIFAPEGLETELTVGVYGEETKLTSMDNEGKVKNLQVFVFREDGKIDGYGTANNATSLTLSTTIGKKTIYALVNCPDFSTLKTMDNLKSKVSDLALKSSTAYVNAAADNFEMVGSASKTLSSSDKTNGVKITVNRLAARVKIDKITRDFSRTSGSSSYLAKLSADKFKIVRMYLTDVVGNCCYSGSTPSGKVWYSSKLASTNPGKIMTDFPLVYEKPATTVTLADKASHSTPHSFYCYPNSTTEDSSTARVTRLVIECQIDDAYYTYPILLSSGVGSNKSYLIKELVITRLGNPSNGDDVADDSEGQKIDYENIKFDVTVNPWSEVLITSNGQSEGTVVI